MRELPRRRFIALAAAAGALAGFGPLRPAWATSSSPVLTRLDPAHPKRQIRGIWIATVRDDDWPAAAGQPAAQQQAELVTLLDQLAAMRMNTVYFQVRPTADAFYNSAYEPWSQYLTGTQGADPGYDPLELAISEAHSRNMELHAWMNPYRVSLQSDITKLVPWHPARIHPDWTVSYGGQLWYNPGVPAVREFDLNVITDVATHYDIDGIHFDDYFYPYPAGSQVFGDSAAFAAYGDGYTDLGDWRRHNVDLLVSEVSALLPTIKPWLKWGVAPFGIWRNNTTDPLGSATNGLQSYDAIYADSRGWVKNNWLDYIVPEIYWNIGFPPAAFDVLMPWWSDVVSGTQVQLAIGQAAYKIGSSSPVAWQNPAEMPDHLVMEQSYPHVMGDVWFDTRALLADPLGFTDQLTGNYYEYPALIPVMPRLGGQAPEPTRLLTAQRTAGGVQLRWVRQLGQRGVAPTYYAIYRFDGDVTAAASDFSDARNIAGTYRPQGVSYDVTWIDTSASPGAAYTYYVTALDRLNHESQPGNPVVLTQ